MSSNAITSALLGAGVTYALTSFGEAKSPEGDEAIDAESYKKRIESLNTLLASTNEELNTIQGAKERLQDAYDRLVADGGEMNASFYQRTIESLNERISFLSKYLSAELGRSVDMVSTHAVKKLPGLYIDRETRFTSAINDPSLYRGPNGDIRLHNAATLPCYPDVMYQNADGDLAVYAPSSIHSNSGSVGFRLHAGKIARFRTTNPSAANVKDRYRRANVPYVGGTPTEVNSGKNEYHGKIYNPYVLIEFSEDTDVHDLLDKVAVLAFHRYTGNYANNGTVETGFRLASRTGKKYAWMSYNVVPLRRNVLLVNMVASASDYDLPWPADFGIESTVDLDLKVKSMNMIHSPNLVHGASGDTSAQGHFQNLRPTIIGTDIQEYKKEMFFL